MTSLFHGELLTSVSLLGTRCQVLLLSVLLVYVYEGGDLCCRAASACAWVPACQPTSTVTVPAIWGRCSTGGLSSASPHLLHQPTARLPPLTGV